MTADLRQRVLQLLRRMISDSRSTTSNLLAIALSLPDQNDVRTLRALEALEQGILFPMSPTDQRALRDVAEELRAEIKIPGEACPGAARYAAAWPGAAGLGEARHGTGASERRSR